MMEYKLEKLEMLKLDNLYSFYQELPADECGFRNDAFGLTLSEFKEYLAKRIESSNGINLKPGRVPSTEYIFSINGSMVGIGRIRHYLTEELMKHAGHISFAIKPECRGNGYAGKLLSKLIIEAKLKKIPKVLLTCNVDNFGSFKTIEKNGGVLEKIENGERFYWIDL